MTARWLVMVVSDPLPVYAFVGGIGGVREEERGCLGAEEDGELGKGEGFCAEVGGVGLEGAAVVERGGECGTFRKWAPGPLL